MQTRKLFERVIHNWPAKFVSLAAAIVLLLVNDIVRLEERFISVPLDLRLPDQLVPDTPPTNRVRIGLRGDPEQVFLILDDDIRAVADFSRYELEGEYRRPVSIVLSGSALQVEPLEVTVEPAEVVVSLETKVRRSLPVEPAFSGTPGEGFELRQYFLTPNAVEVEGPRSQIDTITEIRTEEIDLSLRQEDFIVRVRLVRPSSAVAFPGGDTIEFRGLVRDTVVVGTFDRVDVVVENLPEGVRIARLPDPGVIRAQGSSLQMETVDLKRLKLSADGSVVDGPGTFVLPLTPRAPAGVRVLGYEPTEVEIEVLAE